MSTKTGLKEETVRDLMGKIFHNEKTEHAILYGGGVAAVA